MGRVSFDSLPPYAILGGTLEGALVVETDKPIDGNRVTISLRGTEIAQIEVHRPMGQNRSSTQVLTQKAPFLEQSVVPTTLGAIGPGTMRIPFSFALPPDGPASLATSPLPTTRGRLFARPNGCYIEYELEGKIEVPWWISPVDREVIPVVGTRRTLGWVPPIRLASDGSRPSLFVDVDRPTVVPGVPLTGSFQVANPSGKHLRSITLALQRRVQYTAQGSSGESAGPVFSVNCPLDTKDPAKAGRFVLPIPDSPDASPPDVGPLHRTLWNFTARVDVAFGLDVQVSEPLGSPPA